MYCLVKDTPDPRCEYAVMNDRDKHPKTKWSSYETEDALEMPLRKAKYLASKLKLGNVRPLPADEVFAQIEKQRAFR